MFIIIFGLWFLRKFINFKKLLPNCSRDATVKQDQLFFLRFIALSNFGLK
jgi:hypothetical protein